MALTTLTRIFESLGYQPCDSGLLEDEYEKVVMYGANDVVSHAAKQLPNGKWSSKLGESFDISHDSAIAVAGRMYGQVLRYLRRPVARPKSIQPAQTDRDSTKTSADPT
jgi:hypothetical protein